MAPPDFIPVAERFVAFVDTSSALGREELVRQLERQLLDLYAAGLDLRPVEPTDESAPLKSMTEDERAALHQRLATEFGEFDGYRFIFDPYDHGATPVTGSLADDVADVYRELTDGLSVLKTGGDLRRALWEWRLGFDNHWGRHVAHALYAVYAVTADRLGGHS
jgi:Domain of unknown function (DUF5063)